LRNAAVNEAINVVRARKRQKTSDEDVYALEIPVTEPERDENLDRMNAAIEKMTPELKETLSLHYQEELSCVQIARIQRRPIGSVYSDVWRARRQLKKLIAEDSK
jgi:RNA polymerase sigma factor (sigma-70 family)